MIRVDGSTSAGMFHTVGTFRHRHEGRPFYAVPRDAALRPHPRFGPAADDAEKTTFALYNLEQDLGEKHDVSGRFPGMDQDLKTGHVQWLRSFATPDDAKQPVPAKEDRAERQEKRKRKREKKDRE